MKKNEEESRGATVAEVVWDNDDWLADAKRRVRLELAGVDVLALGDAELVKRWGRSCIFRVQTNCGEIWVKHGYALPPGEDRTLSVLHQRYPGQVPNVICAWDGAVAMAAIPGAELSEGSPADDWALSAALIASIAAGERDHIDQWLMMGVRDRRPAAFGEGVEAILGSPVLSSLPAKCLRQFSAMIPAFVDRFEHGFTSAASLVHQDSGCCNFHLTETGPVLFDWADVVVGHPVFSCDRLLDQTPVAYRESTIRAFLSPLGMTRQEFDLMRRANVLHEIIRYHDELSYLPEDSDIAISLRRSVTSQIEMLVNHYTKRVD